jgi:hypothetical protein
MAIDASFFQPGDIICFDRAPWLSAQTFTQTVQFVESFVQNTIAVLSLNTVSHFTLSAIAVHHVAICVEAGLGAAYADATGDLGIRMTPLVNIRQAHVRIFRLKAAERQAARDAANVAACWCTKPKGGYSNARAVAAALRPSFYGPFAMNLADHYHEHRNRDGGPPGLLVGTGTDMFCTTFVIACYQAALGWRRSMKLMARDATNCLPSTLTAYLSSRDSVWDDLGTHDVVHAPPAPPAAPTVATVATVAALPAAPALPALPMAPVLPAGPVAVARPASGLRASAKVVPAPPGTPPRRAW